MLHSEFGKMIDDGLKKMDAGNFEGASKIFESASKMPIENLMQMWSDKKAQETILLILEIIHSLAFKHFAKAFLLSKDDKMLELGQALGLFELSNHYIEKVTISSKKNVSLNLYDVIELLDKTSDIGASLVKQLIKGEE